MLKPLLKCYLPSKYTPPPMRPSKLPLVHVSFLWDGAICSTVVEPFVAVHSVLPIQHVFHVRRHVVLQCLVVAVL